MKPTFFATPADFRAWLEANHESERELLVAFYKRGTGKASITWPESVDEALCFGWIDGVRRRLSQDAYSIRFTPRTSSSTWSLINVARVTELTRVGRMRPSGLRAFAARKGAKTGVYSFERAEPATLSRAQEKSLRANRKAALFFDAQPPWYRRAALHWVVSAKREDTRERRLARLIADSAAGRTIAPLTRPNEGREQTKGARRAKREPSKKEKPNAAAPSSSSAFEHVVAAFRSRDGIEEPSPSRRAFGSNGIKVNGKIFAMLVRERFVVKLPRARVEELVRGGFGQPFDAGRGTQMREWVVIEAGKADWVELAREAHRFVLDRGPGRPGDA